MYIVVQTCGFSSKPTAQQFNRESLYPLGYKTARMTVLGYWTQTPKVQVPDAMTLEVQAPCLVVLASYVTMYNSLGRKRERESVCVCLCLCVQIGRLITAVCFAAEQ